MNRNPNWRPREYNAANDHEFDDHSKASNFRPVSNRLFISNLNPSLSNFDLKVSIETKDNKKIFSRYGDLTRCGLHWDILGNSRGTADIEYETIEDAQEAIRSLDSKPAKFNLIRLRNQWTKNICAVRKKTFRKS